MENERRATQTQQETGQDNGWVLLRRGSREGKGVEGGGRETDEQDVQQEKKKSANEKERQGGREREMV